MGICCSQIQPYHATHESTIVFDSGICYCGTNPRRASGKPVACSREEYDAIADKACHLGMQQRICCEANFCGTPCCGHGWPLETYTQELQGSYPHLEITIYDSYEGCDDQGHWEFVISIRKRAQITGSTTTTVRAPTTSRMDRQGGDQSKDSVIVSKRVITETVYNPDGSKTVTETVEEVPTK